MKIVVDAMGSDAAPANEAAGCVKALKESPELEILLVGEPKRVGRELAKYSVPGGRIEVVPASETIGMDEKPAEALRKKKDASIRVGAICVREGRGEAFVSAGNTGAATMASLIAIGRAPGIRRPAIAALFPSREGHCVVLDVGANVICKGVHLHQFAIMGEVYAQCIFNIDQPRVGLLSIGEEAAKGSGAIFEAHRLLSRSPINYVGYVEGGDILRGKADVVACDGFTGNALLKFAESVPAIVFSGLRSEVKRDLIVRIGAGLSRAALRRVKKRWDYAEYGGAPLLGVNGGVIICHGKSSPKAIMNAVLVAEKFIHFGATRLITEKIGRCGNGR
ncbi:MAG: phosphate acyltransferase PlsX [candidate division Zixibacteria bacterium]|nr:phosphate acyltransferase PlsX [candidate division Zixibacteria bacterium]